MVNNNPIIPQLTLLIKIQSYNDQRIQVLLVIRTIQQLMIQEIQKTSKEDLVAILHEYQYRSINEEIDALRRLSPTPDPYFYSVLNTHPSKGIPADPEDISHRIAKYGSNAKQLDQPIGFFALMWHACRDLTIRILIVAAFISIAIKIGTSSSNDRKLAWLQGFVILLAITICILVTAINNYQKERQFIEINEVADKRKRVTTVRNGVFTEMHQDEVLVGDVVILTHGMDIPADGYLIEANHILVDESAMTGETEPIHKDTFLKSQQKQTHTLAQYSRQDIDRYDIPSPILMSGTKILSGEGRMIVLVVGSQSCLGKIKSLLIKGDPVLTPLQQKLDRLTTSIGKVAMISTASVMFVLFLRFGIEKGISKTWNNSVDLMEILNIFIFGVAILVLAIPEGLPLSVTLSLTYSVKKMLLDNNLVRKLEACEIMGGANTICSDKTGTLTMNKMVMTTLWNSERLRIPYENETIKMSEIVQESIAQLFKMSVCLNSSAMLVPEEKGSATEIALLKLIQKTGVNYEEERQKHVTLCKFPFDSRRKRMSVVTKIDHKNVLLIKGASEIILECCGTWYNQFSRQEQMMTEQTKEELNRVIDKMAKQCLRTLCLAYKYVPEDFSHHKDENGVHDIEKQNLILLAIVGVKDAPRPEVPDAIKKCKTAGIKVRMVTGDNLVTAKAIAMEVGIIDEEEEHLVMEGPEFSQLIGGVVCNKCRVKICECERSLELAKKNNKDVRVDVIYDMDQFEKIASKLSVLARSRPEDKYALVTGLKDMNKIVAVTGDGTNDAPALQKADVGFAMGISGTEVAREAASIIVLDDNFYSIVKAVMWGRNIYDSIKKFLQLSLPASTVGVATAFVGGALFKQAIMQPIQILWIDLVVNTLASLALSTEPPSEQLLNREPIKREDSIITRKMAKHIIGQALYQFIVIIILTFTADKFIPEYYDGFDLDHLNNLDCKYGTNGYMRSGRLSYINGVPDYSDCFGQTKVFSRHFSFLFNTFVIMQIFNFLNCRKLYDEKNIFEGITRNWIFFVTLIAIFILQALIVTFGSVALGVYAYYGQTIQHWLISIAFGSLSLVVNYLLKFINEDRICGIREERISPVVLETQEELGRTNANMNNDNNA